MELGIIFSFFKVSNFQILTLQKIPKKYLDIRNVILYHCKFSEWHTLYFGLNKNKKIAQEDKIMFYVYYFFRLMLRYIN
jgi:hypothetical protein